MEKPNSIVAQLSALESVIRSLLATTNESQLKEFHSYLTKLWDDIENSNTHPHISEQLKLSKEMAIKMSEAALRVHSQ
ncbi:hypothetical protein [Yersinia enterocolitica]|uniref:hypothetical protein n=1 Tax=Yersinia enterocolitica TaxID=630 RepID=UPI001C209425|nr:hypothetical protein [Yersinia enterocolitica]